METEIVPAFNTVTQFVFFFFSSDTRTETFFLKRIHKTSNFSSRTGAESRSIPIQFFLLDLSELPLPYHV